VFVPLVLMPTSGGLRRVFGLFPSVRAGMLATGVAAAIGFAVNDSGIAVPAFFAALAVPLAVATTLRTLAGARSGVLGTHRAGTYRAGAGSGRPHESETSHPDSADRQNSKQQDAVDGAMQPVGSPPAAGLEDGDR